MDTQAWEEEGSQVMDKFNFKMLSSGYSEHERRVIVKEVLARVANLKAKVSSGKRPLYRKPHGGRRKEESRRNSKPRDGLEMRSQLCLSNLLQVKL